MQSHSVTHESWAVCASPHPRPPGYAAPKAAASVEPQAEATTGAAEYHVNADLLTDTGPAKEFGRIRCGHAASRCQPLHCCRHQSFRGDATLPWAHPHSSAL